MKAGLDLLYSRNDPEGAAAQFRGVLALNPSHYGATFQLGTALDRAGKPGEAQPYWEKMLAMAEATGDDATVATVRARLRQPPPASEEGVQGALMRAGLDALYTKGDPNAAAVEFSKDLVGTSRLRFSCFHSFHAAPDLLLPGGFHFRRKVLLRFGKIQEDSGQGQTLTRREVQGVFSDF